MSFRASIGLGAWFLKKKTVESANSDVVSVLLFSLSVAVSIVSWKVTRVDRFLPAIIIIAGDAS